ncbi:hypothetical protein HDU98_008215 [Podochytrium sp. JEL0797]|nr:hypothetical protein HDU98_008215 [Podochytrium sp. JEL0797]
MTQDTTPSHSPPVDEIASLLARLDAAQSNLISATVANAARLLTPIKAERRFLASAQRSPDAKRRIQAAACSNAGFLAAVVEAAVGVGGWAADVCRQHGHDHGGVQKSEEESLSVGQVGEGIARVTVRARKKSACVVDVMLEGAGVPPVWVKVRAGAVRGERADYCDSDGDDSCSEDEDSQGNHSEREESIHSTRESSHPASPSVDLSNLSIVRQAKAWIAAAKENPVHFITPKIVFCFASEQSRLEDEDPIDRILLDSLMHLGVQVVFGIENLVTCIQEYAAEFRSGNDSNSPASLLLTQTLNLDLTTLISLVSDTCHRFETIPKNVYDVDALVQQEARESTSPLLNTLYPIFSTRTLVTTATAFTKFMKISSVIAGPFEKHRIRLLFDTSRMPVELVALLHEATAVDGDCGVTESQVKDWTSEGLLVGKVGVVEDMPSVRFRAMLAPGVVGGGGGGAVGNEGVGKRGGKGTAKAVKVFKVSEANVMIYGTGDAMGWTTVTGNSGIVRSFEMNLGNAGAASGEDGVDGGFGVSVYLHTPRSLIETRNRKERV